MSINGIGRAEFNGSGEAAVGLLINGDRILFIKRIKRDGDPWSGQIALPGGFVKPGESKEFAVLREILEEVSLDLNEESIVNRMPAEHPTNRRSVTVYPFVLSVGGYDGASPGPEVDDIRVVRFSELVHREHYYYGRNAYTAGDWIIWGLTYKILTSYFSRDGAEKGQ